MKEEKGKIKWENYGKIVSKKFWDKKGMLPLMVIQGYSDKGRRIGENVNMNSILNEN
jgi:hypothetical protein